MKGTTVEVQVEVQKYLFSYGGKSAFCIGKEKELKTSRNFASIPFFGWDFWGKCYDKAKG